MLEELKDKKANILRDAEVHREMRNKFNSEASKWSSTRDELNAKTRSLVDEAQKHKELRDQNNNLVHEHKVKRDELNEQANKVYAEVDHLRKKCNLSGGKSLKELQRDLDRLEFRQQTEVLSPEKEKALVDQISELREEFRNKKKQLEQNKELKDLLDKAQALRDEASNYHKNVMEFADLAQEYHDKMIVEFKEADKVRAEADEAHKKFVEAQETADENHRQFIKAQKEIRDFNKVLAGLRKKTRGRREDKELIAIRKQAEEVYSLFKNGEKLDTEDILLLQRSGLL